MPAWQAPVAKSNNKETRPYLTPWNSSSWTRSGFRGSSRSHRQCAGLDQREQCIKGLLVSLDGRYSLFVETFMGDAYCGLRHVKGQRA